MRLADGRRLAAVAYVAQRDHAQYAGALDTIEVARLVAQGHGRYGPNIDYVRNTQAHLAAMGLRDARLAAVIDRLG